MRDPNRIPEMLAALEKAWTKNPDLRLGQMIVIATPERFHNDPFNVEDDEMLRALNALGEEPV